MDRAELGRLSRTVAYALRHAPWLYELEVEDAGWVPVDQLLEALRTKRRGWRHLVRDDLTAMIAVAKKRRYELEAGRIRALYGHSLPGKLSKEPAPPPKLLFHGTTPKALGRIMEEGLLSMKRQYVHLSSTREAARHVGRRKSEDPTILVVHARDAYADGVPFYRANEHVWLADRIPPASRSHYSLSRSPPARPKRSTACGATGQFRPSPNADITRRCSESEPTVAAARRYSSRRSPRTSDG